MDDELLVEVDVVVEEESDPDEPEEPDEEVDAVSDAVEEDRLSVR